jgi:multidrug efflux pump subunit AcrB
VLAGIVTILFLTHTSLNIESFMGSIMCLGVSVSNSVMLVTFMNEHVKMGKPSAEAAIVGAGERMRPILMTACAMTVGMVPMALALERGSQMQAPLGLAVIGGLVMSTFATLLVLPSVFAIGIDRKEACSGLESARVVLAKARQRIEREAKGRRLSGPPETWPRGGRFPHGRP